MNPALSSPSRHTVTRRPARSGSRTSQRPDRPRREHLALSARAPLARYTDPHGNPREVIARQALAGSVLVVDRDAVSLGDCLLVAHLAADEPAENAVLVCRDYLEDVRRRSCRCRGLTEQDALVAPLAEDAEPHRVVIGEFVSVDSLGCNYSLELVSSAGMSIPALRWCRGEPRQISGEPRPVSLRETIAQVEDYEPMCTLTQDALLAYRDDLEVSTSVLGAELTRVRESPIVLNRRLREVVLAALRREELSLSEIALRCGRTKRDSKGNESGETSWLARRLGLLPESGQKEPSPWIHNDVLALIARRGLGISPREVEIQ
jgi:hypothetical protein